MYNLLIVESPTKCRTIGKFLGKDYKVLASGGHIVDLPKSKIGVDVQHSFAPEYKTMAGKKEIVDEIKKAAKNAQKIFLATDPDREGEAISWHIAHLLNIDERDECRVVFNEITSQAVREGIKHPRPIDRNLVDAQQARRVLDRLVGYEISPVLWRKVKTGLSAGRVQSPAVKLIVERQRAIDSFVPEEYWLLGVVLMKERKKFTASFYGTAEGKLELKTKEQTEQIISSLEGAEYVVTKYKEGKKKQHAPSPFTTSLLQQEASRKLGFSAKRTMSVAQSLYEGIEINGEGVGLITYIRTDSLRIAAEAITEVREYIGGKYGAEYLPASPNFYKSKKNIQDAHESIRPTSLSREPESVRTFLSADQFKLYKLIFERFVACQMSEAVYKTKSADIAAGKYIFRATASERVFDGFMSVYIEGKDNEEAKEKKQTLSPLAEGDKPSFIEFKYDQHFTEPPPYYTEASLVKELEEQGIGRPSTYAPIISTIIERQYVERVQKKLVPTALGICVNDFMTKSFPDIVDVHFTAVLETKLDKVEEGDKNWVDVMKEFYTPFEKSVEQAGNSERVKVPVEETDIKCEKCGRNMVIRSSRFGKFLACPGYPECKNTKPLPKDEVSVPCPKCGGKLVKKTSKKSFKKFYGCENYPDCDFAAPGLPTGEKCPECGGILVSGFKGRAFCINPDCPTRLKKQAEEQEKTEKKTAGKKTKS